MKRAGAGALVVGLGVGLLTACGSDEPVTLSGGTWRTLPPEDQVRGGKLADRAMRLLSETDSVRLKVSMTAPQGTREVSLLVDRKGNCSGTFDEGEMKSGEIRVLADGLVFFRFRDSALDAILAQAALRGPAVEARVKERTALVRGKFMAVPAKDPSTAALHSQCDLDRLMGPMGSGGGQDNKNTRAKPETYRDGKRVIPLVDAKGEMDATLYVAADEKKPYALAMEMRQGRSRMEMEFSDNGKTVQVKAPPPSEIADIDLGSAGSLLEA
ncbi:hypothetical protein [Streptomyces sp. NPDC059009]|uniref:hypothetical protein n=1 Tax=Streptomyces sp. NPDC059009 TaxID=3346694 RepID=UPI00369E54AC